MRVLLATGKEAAGSVTEAIRSVTAVICDVLTQDLNIAAFSTPKSLKRALETNYRSEKPDLILVSGLCKSDFSGLEKEIGTPIRLGPRQAYDLGDILAFAEKIQLSHHIPADELIAVKRREDAKTHLDALECDIDPEFTIKGVKIGGGARLKVCAEIVDATQLSSDTIERKMVYFLENGADIIDLGVHIGAKPDEVKRAVKAALAVADDIPISVDTLDGELILTGIETGVDMVLSLTNENIPKVGDAIAKNDVAAVVIPDSSPESLFANMKMATEHGIKHLIADPVLNAIGYGIANSLYNYYLFREEDKGTPLFFGVGNVTELMDADSTGVNATLAGIASDLNADILFTPEYSDKARGSVRELRIASEMMMLAKARKSAPKDIGLDLLVLKEKRRKQIMRVHDELNIPAMTNEGWKLDPKGCFRIGICTVENGTMLYAEHIPTRKRIIDSSAKAVMDTILRLGLISLLDHAAYLSMELTKAELALRLDRNYGQDEELFK
ncbi:Dihydropteroate synthase [Methanophagales archaeon]|nr:Dihydropteroate synthase [Methanophagales archaeon]